MTMSADDEAPSSRAHAGNSEQNTIGIAAIVGRGLYEHRDKFERHSAAAFFFSYPKLFRGPILADGWGIAVRLPLAAQDRRDVRPRIRVDNEIIGWRSIAWSHAAPLQVAASARVVQIDCQWHPLRIRARWVHAFRGEASVPGARALSVADDAASAVSSAHIAQITVNKPSRGSPRESAARACANPH